MSLSALLSVIYIDKFMILSLHKFCFMANHSFKQPQWLKCTLSCLGRYCPCHHAVKTDLRPVRNV